MKISTVILFLGFFFCSFPGGIQAYSREKRNAPVPSPEIIVSLKIDLNTSVVNKTVAAIIMKVQNGTLLVDILNKAAGDNKHGPFNKYNSTYYGGLGYFITAMNGTKQDPATSTYWLLFDEKTGGALPCGVSSYVPINQSTTIFRYTDDSSSHNDTVTGYCKTFPSSGHVPPPAITVTIEQNWNVTSVGKPIPAPYTTQVTNGTVLVDIMNKAANEETNGPYNKYTSTYYGGLGHFITSMNGTKQDPSTGTYWMIYDKATGKLIPLGVDSYQPQDGSTTIFRLVKGASHESSTAAKTESPTDKESEPNNSSGKCLVVELMALCLLADLEGLLFL